MTEVLMWHSKKPRRSQLRGFSIPLWQGGLFLRLATAYLSPSSHLQMQQATTLAKTESKKDENILMVAHPLSVPVQGWQRRSLYHSGRNATRSHEVKENTVQEVRKALQANIEAIQRATKLLEKQSDTLTSVMKQKIRELEESKNSFFRYEGLKLYLFWGGMVCNILVFLMLLYGMISK